MDRISGGVVICLATAILWQARSLPLGKISAPGPGFFPTVIAMVLLVLALLLILTGAGKKEKTIFTDKRAAGRVLLVFLFLVAYILLLEYLGFAVTSFLFMAALFITVTQRKWYSALLWSFAATGFAYVLFEILLKSNLPKGVLGF